MEAVRSLCRQCGIDPKSLRMDLIGRLQQEIKNRASYDKVFSQIWGASGMLYYSAERELVLIVLCLLLFHMVLLVKV